MIDRSRAVRALLAAGALLASFGCGSKSGPSLRGLTPSLHGAFPITAVEHTADCATCHQDAATFSTFDCTGCHAHQQAPTDAVHVAVADYTYASAECYRCHQVPVPNAFSHNGVTGTCASCHEPNAAFAALPVAGFTHIPYGSDDCGSCHTIATWSSGSMPGTLVHDTSRDVAVTGLVPSFSGTSIVAVSALAQQLPMSMNHRSAALDSTTMADCAGCHDGAASGAYFPGSMHSSLANRALPQPGLCVDCHGDAAPTGFVGPTAAHPARNPASGEMRHEAVAWSGGAPTSTRLVPVECAVCHQGPSASRAATWATNPSGAGVPTYHASLTAAAMPQPGSCLDCHANSRPGTLTPANAALPAGMSFDHAAPANLGDCASCHLGTTASARFTSWAGGRFHHAGDTTPASCLPCHAGERPTSTSGWASTTYTASPFDYVTNAAGVTHGDGRDCVVCHAGPGTGQWGSSQNWVGGHFAHGAGTVAATTCIACHMTQRPDLQPGTTPADMARLLGFDHSLSGTGDCFGCHQETVTRGRYVDYVNATTHQLPNGDWMGGKFYPGSTLSASDQFVRLTEITLHRTGSLVTSMTSATATLYNAMLHTSSAIPWQIFPGPADAPVDTRCQYCHTHDASGTVTSYANARFHSSVASYPLPQPTGGCSDCHAQMVPVGIVEASGSDLQPMDHAARFASPVVIGGVTAAGVADLDCGACHETPGVVPGVNWAGAAFHSNIAGAAPADCTVCHYPLMADSARADVASGALYTMSHRSATITVQRCDACHGTALSRSTGTPAASLWRPGAFHASVAAQPSACLDCHAGSAPTGPTQSTVTYALVAGGTATNGAQWMSHAAGSVAGVDCARCHAADAKASGAAWSESTAFHAHATSPGTCRACHGLTNGNGSAVGTGNNMPAGLTDSTMVTTAANNTSTGVPAGTHDQLTHADVNVTGFDCGFCHTQSGPSTVAGVQGKEWAQAAFHTRFSSTTPLTMNGTTGRCSNCHMNVRPGTSFTAQNHSAFTSTSAQDCAACHAWPGTGTPTAPNWLGGGGVPQYIYVGGFTIPAPPAPTPRTQPGITNLPHPSTATRACSACHTGGVGGKRAIGYDHASGLITQACNACHEAGTNLLGTVWNGVTTQSAGAGDSRPFTLTSVVASEIVNSGSCTIRAANHFYPVDCGQCHVIPSGTGATTTGTAYTNAWTFPHRESKMTNPSTCNLCHTSSCPR